MRDKNDWKGSFCALCRCIFTDEYAQDSLYFLNSCHETIAGARIWYCGKCNLAQQEQRKKEAQEAAKLKGGAFG